MAYNPRAYVPGGATPAVASAIQNGGKIAREAGRTGQRARVTAPVVGSPAWLASASDDVLQSMLFAGPDYRGISADPAKITKQASSYANAQTEAILSPYRKEYEADKGELAREKAVSLEAATNFTKALASILTGGLEGEAGREYAMKTFGGSYLGEAQTAEGLRMAVDLTRGFDEQAQKLTEQWAEIAAKRPDIYSELYNDFVKQEIANRKQQIDLRDSQFEHRAKAITLILAARAKERGAGGADVTYVTQPGGGVVGFDKQTGQVVYTIPGTGDGGTTAKAPTTKKFPDGTLRAWNGSGWQVIGEPTGGAGAPDVSPSTASTTVARATAAGETALKGVMDKVATSALKGYKDEGKARAAVPGLLTKSFGSAMYRVVTAIGPHLKPLGYSNTQIKRAAYEIVSAKIDPPKGYKPPRASKNVAAATSSSLPGSQFANYSGPTPSDDVIYRQYKASAPMSDEQLVQVLRQAGFSGQGLQIAYSIAKRESGGNPLAFNPNRSTGDRSWGLFQINTLGDMISRVRQFGLRSEMQLLDPVANARAAFRMTDGGRNWYHWGVDTGYGAYRNAPVKMLPLPGTV